jgi:thioredoxin-like negative regulator of GroEL
MLGRLAATALGGSRPTRPQLVAAALVLLGLGAIGFVPLFDGPGYEVALAAGLWCPAIAAVAAGIDLGRTRPAPLEALSRGLATGARLAVLGYLTTVAHGLRAGFCDFWGGSLLFILGPGLGTVLGGGWGAVAGELAGRITKPRRRTAAAVALGLGGPLATALLELGLFYATPVVFAYDPFVGYFSGTLYDTVLEPGALLTYRAATLATLFAAYVAALHLQRTPEARLRWRPRGRPGLGALGVLCGFGSLCSVALGAELGHWQTRSTLGRELGGRIEHGQCLVLYARSIDRDEIARFARDCDGHLAALSAWFGVPVTEPVTVFLFADAGDKRRLMGAADTSVAKPWRREIYLQSAGYPHGAVGHELAHVVAGQVGRGPFRIAGTVGGLLPNPGLIEGVAVASQAPEGDLRDEEWAKAMRDVEVLPRLDELFTLGFLGKHASTAYTAAGAFVGWVHDRFGAEVVRRWYGGAELPMLTGLGWRELEDGWHQALDRIALGDAARAQAKARFDRPSVFGRRCPHVVDEKLQTASWLADQGDLGGALRAYDAVLGLDPTNDRAELGKAGCWSHAGQEQAAAVVLGALSEAAQSSQSTRNRALEDLGDLSLRAGRRQEAKLFYERAARAMVDEDRLRTLEVKRLGCDDELARPTLVALLVGSDRHGPSELEGLDALGSWRAASPEDGLPDYLLARRYLDAGRYGQAAAHLDLALAKRIGIRRVQSEALRLRLRAACALGDEPAAAEALRRYAAEPDVPAARIAAARALLARCAAHTGT